MYNRNYICFPLFFSLEQLFVSIHGRRLKVASVILSSSVKTLQKVEDRIKTLRSNVTQSKTSFAFMFACLGRGEGLHDVRNVESSMFRKHFPTTPLVGLFGNGEIGCDFCDAGQQTSVQSDFKRKKIQTKLYHSYTTVFIVFSVDS